MYRQRESLTNNSAFPFCLISINRNTIPINGITAHAVTLPCTDLSAVALYGITTPFVTLSTIPTWSMLPSFPQLKNIISPAAGT